MVMWFYTEGLSGVKWGWEISLGCFIFVRRHWETKIQTDKINNNYLYSGCSALSLMVLSENTLVICFCERVVGSNAKRPHFPSLTLFFCFCISCNSLRASVMLGKTTLGKEIHKCTENIWKQIISIQGENAVFSHCSCSSLFSVFGFFRARTVKAVSSVSSYQTKQGKKKKKTLWVLRMSLNNRFHVVIYHFSVEILLLILEADLKIVLWIL